MQSFDVVIIGSGPGGYACAIRAAQLGLSVACVEKRETFGGTCLNVGCIPSKAMLHTSHAFFEAQHAFDAMGIQAQSVSFDLEKMMAFKESAIDGNTKGVEFLFKKNKVKSFFGEAQLAANRRVLVRDLDGKQQEIEGRSIVIATGSDVGNPTEFEIDEKHVLSSTGALELSSVPKSMLVVGGGVIGLELGSVWSRLGTQVRVVELATRILSTMDSTISSQLQKALTKQGIVFSLGTKVESFKKKKNGFTIALAQGDKKETIEVETVLVAVGRKPYTQGLGLEACGISCDARGFIEVNEDFKTKAEGIYAIGDVIPGPMLAHKAMEEGVAVAQRLARAWAHVDYTSIPSVVYTSPEVASVGLSEEQAKSNGEAYKAFTFPFMANGRAKANQQTDGFVKIIGHKDTDRVLGVHIMAPNAGEMIHEAALAISFKASCEDIAMLCHAHPTFSESIKEAALGVFDKPIHM